MRPGDPVAHSGCGVPRPQTSWEAMVRAGDRGVDRVPRVGCDLAETAAVRTAMDAFGERYLSRVYSHEERSQTGEAPDRLAARFAGKEAVLKLLGADGLAYHQVEIVTSASGQPLVRLSGNAAARASADGVGPIAISLSHEGGFALATAIALASGPDAEWPTRTTNKTTEGE